MCTDNIPGQQVRFRVRSVPALSSLRCFTCQHHRRRCMYAIRVMRALGGGELRTAWTWAETSWRTPIYVPRGGHQLLSMGRIRVENVGSGSQVRREHPNPPIQSEKNCGIRNNKRGALIVRNVWAWGVVSELTKESRHDKPIWIYSAVNQLSVTPTFRALLLAFHVDVTPRNCSTKQP